MSAEKKNSRNKNKGQLITLAVPHMESKLFSPLCNCANNLQFSVHYPSQSSCVNHSLQEVAAWKNSLKDEKLVSRFCRSTGSEVLKPFESALLRLLSEGTVP